MLRYAARTARRLPAEVWWWTAGLLALAATDPTAPGMLSLCVWDLLGVPQALGWSGCPGCGLGHAVAFLLDGRLAHAWQTHPLAPFALLVLLGRIATLVRGAMRRRVATPAR